MFANYYIDRFTEKRELIADAPSFDLNMSVVIPAFNEPNLLKTLESLLQCDITQKAVEIIVVLNYSVDTTEHWQTFHQNQYNELCEWSKLHSTTQRKFHILLEKLPGKHAGVGLARKTGMDEAVRRFNLLNKPTGIVVGFDADCSCDNNYLLEIEFFFSEKRKINGCSIYFEHPLSGNEYDKEVYESIVLYELYLRYYIAGLRYAGLPYAYHTIGSSFAVSAEAYIKQGGMNRLKAGEDFYFLHKIIALGNYYNLNSTTVRPSPRKSDRVPFGTGAAITKMLNSSDVEYLTFDPQVFSNVKKLTDSIERAYHSTQNFLECLDNELCQFLKLKGIESKLEQIRQNCSTQANFAKRFLQWFDGLMVLQYFNSTLESTYKPMPIREAAIAMLKIIEKKTDSLDPLDLLLKFRAIDKKLFGQ